MRHSLPSTRYRRLRVLTILAALVALATIGLQAHADTPQPAATGVTGR